MQSTSLLVSCLHVSGKLFLTIPTAVNILVHRTSGQDIVVLQKISLLKFSILWRDSQSYSISLFSDHLSLGSEVKVRISSDNEKRQTNYK